MSRIEWNKTADSAFREEWERKLQGLNSNNNNTNVRTSQLRDSPPSRLQAKQIKSLETYNYKEHPDSSGKSLLGWAQEHNASLVLSLKESSDSAMLSEQTILGWAVPIDPNLSDSNSRGVALFVTENRDILKIKVHEVPQFASQVVKSPMLQECVNQISIRRPVVGALFADFYANCILVGVFISATRDWLFTNVASNDVTALYVLAVYFLLREVLQFTSQRLQYLMDPWNIMDVARVAMTIMAAYATTEGNDDFLRTQRILLACAVFIFAGLISFLRVSFLPFSKFVSGTKKIVFALLPFFVILFIVILGFGYMYWVQDFHCPGDICELIDGFYSAYAFFVGGPENVSNALDIFAGLVLVVILLNIVIAIVTTAWDDTARSEESFWIHRISFLIELRLFLKVTDRNESKKPNSIDFIGRDLDSRLDVLVDKWWNQDMGIRERVRICVHLFCYGLFYLFLILLGLVTFGFYWPVRVRMLVFGNSHSTDRLCMKEEVERLRQEVQQTRADISDIKQGMNEILRVLNQLPGIPSSTKDGDSKSRPNSPRKPSEGVVTQPKNSRVQTSGALSNIGENDSK